MRFRAGIVIVCGAVSAWGVLVAQKPFKQYDATEYIDFPLPDDWNEKTEWTRARLRYDAVNPHGGFGRGGRRLALHWTTDYPRSDRHLLAGVRRLTRINTRSVEQVVDLDGTDDVYNWPMLYAVEVGYWNLHDEQTKQLRDFVDRGGFFMCDDFHGTDEWENFMRSFSRVFPDREIVDLDNSDPIFHTLYDLDERFQVPGWGVWTRRGITYEYDGVTPKWRGVYDNKNRLIAVICHNMDLGDAWEWSDNPQYPEKFASLAYRIAMNYFIYDLTP
jgi:hypothetical protein